MRRREGEVERAEAGGVEGRRLIELGAYAEERPEVVLGVVPHRVVLLDLLDLRLRLLTVAVTVAVTVGDTVVFSKYGGTELKYDGEEFLLLSARDLLAVIEK